MAVANYGKGNWFGLPEFGVTELFGGNSNSLSTAQANKSSNKSSVNMGTNYTVNTPVASYPNSSGGDVLGLSTASGGNYSSPVQSPTSSIFNDRISAEKDGADAELESLNDEYNYYSDEIRSQLPYAENARNRSLSTLRGALEGARGSVTNAKESARNTFESNVGEAGDVARGVQRANRNVLRSLGILNSTAAGEMLAKPLNEFDKQRAGLQLKLTERVNELDNFLVEKTNEHASLIAQLEDNYSKLVGDIQRDLRFNKKDKANAVKQANAALRARLSEIKNAQLNYELQAQTEQNALATQLKQMQSYSAPTYDANSLGKLSLPAQQAARPQQVGIVDNRDEERYLESLTPSLSRLG